MSWLLGRSASITSKIQDGNIKAALRLLSSEDKPATDNDASDNFVNENENKNDNYTLFVNEN